jgi:hypothetical protein
MADVVIVEYKTPNNQGKVREQEKQINGLTAQVAYLQIMSIKEEV